jgi:hypothetical protein
MVSNSEYISEPKQRECEYDVGGEGRRKGRFYEGELDEAPLEMG